jgi:putative sigma-54 modulation protein
MPGIRGRGQVKPQGVHDALQGRVAAVEGVKMDQPIEFVIRAGQPDTIAALREYAAHRLSFILRRFEPHIRRITVRILDLNGPRRGVDSRCAMTADLVDGRRIFVNATTAWPFASVTQASRRLNEAVRRELRRATSDRQPGGGHDGSTTGR